MSLLVQQAADLLIQEGMETENKACLRVKRRVHLLLAREKCGWGVIILVIL